MFRRTLQRLLLPLGSFKKTNFPNHSPLQNYRQYGKHNKRQNQQSLMPKILISGGILGWLGVEKQPEKVDENHKASQELIQTIQLGVRAVQEGDYQQGELILHGALKIAQTLNHYDGITYVYTLLARLASRQEDYTKAENLYKMIIERQINKGVEENDNSIIDMCLKLAVIYGTLNDHQKANIGFRHCIHAQEEKMKSNEEISDDTHALWAMSCDWYAQYLLNNGQYREALQQFEQAFSISVKLFGDTHPQTLVILNSLGTVCSRMGDDIKAVEYLNKAVALGKDTASENLSTFLVNLGMAKIKLGLKADANSTCQEALLIGKRNNLSEVCAEAEECIKLAA